MSVSRGICIASLVCLCGPLVGGQPPVRFDLPAIAAAETIQTGPDGDLVRFELKLSSMITKPGLAEIDQWLVRCQPRDPSLLIDDYEPRTEVASEIAGPIQIKKTNEKSKSFGLALDGAYGHLARIHGGSDHGTKNVDSYQLDRVAPVQVVTASGTINRGRGVFFKLRWTATQVLEGEKTFRITLRVPSGWRGGLADVSVLAQTEEKPFPGWDREIRTLGSAGFVVAVYRQGDRQAADWARRLFEAEYELRSLASKSVGRPTSSPLKSLFEVVMKWNDDSENAADWFQRLLQDHADPHLDHDIKKLPMSVRVAVLDYVEARDDFLSINRHD